MGTVRRVSYLVFIALFGMMFVTQSSYSADETAIENCLHDATTFRCVKYLRNYDADTVTVRIPDVHPLIGENISVRVNGVDTPEIKGKLPCEKSAAKTAKNLVENLMKRAKRIDLKNVGRDKYFRILADVEVDGQLLSSLLLKNHLAYEYHGETKAKTDWCEFQKRGVATESK